MFNFDHISQYELWIQIFKKKKKSRSLQLSDPWSEGCVVNVSAMIGSTCSKNLSTLVYVIFVVRKFLPPIIDLFIWAWEDVRFGCCIHLFEGYRNYLHIHMGHVEIGSPSDALHYATYPTPKTSEAILVVTVSPNF